MSTSMTKEDILLKAARQALYVLNLVYDNDYGQEIVKARLDLGNALKEYEPIQSDVDTITAKDFYEKE
jgi:hypothetical protein